MDQNAIKQNGCAFIKRSFKALKRPLIYSAFVVFSLPIFLLIIYRLPVIHPVSTLMVKSALSFNSYKRDWISLDDVSPYLPYAIMLSEDNQFCRHGGVDWRELRKVLVETDGLPKRGASTVTMQTVKNLFLWQDRSYIRKSLEIPYAMIAEMILPKKRIMEIYLNISEWGPGIYGIEAAAQYYFQQTAKKLSIHQSAYLVAALPNPKMRDPANPTEQLKNLAKTLATKMQTTPPYAVCLD